MSLNQDICYNKIRMKKLRHLLSINDLNSAQILKILKIASKLKKQLKKTGENKPIFKNKTLAMMFEKPSLRTRISFEIGMTQLGGHAIYLGPADIGLGTREPAKDVASVTCRMADIIMARTFKHETVRELAEYSQVPVINGLSDWEHPCQTLADLLTIQEIKGKLKGLKVVFLGDSENNITHSLALACAKLGVNFSTASPKGYWLNKKISKVCNCLETDDPQKAVKDADVIYTDTWVSMGDEAQKAKRLKIFPKFRVTTKLMKLAKKDAIFMHDLPAYRGNEVEAEVIDGPQSVIYQQAENRLHSQKALMVWLLK